MRDRTYLIFQRCYLATLGIVTGSVAAFCLLLQTYVMLNTVSQGQWVVTILAVSFAVVLAGIGIFGKPNQVITWTDPLRTGETFEFLVIGIAFPLFSVVWIVRKIFVRG